MSRADTYRFKLSKHRQEREHSERELAKVNGQLAKIARDAKEKGKLTVTEIAELAGVHRATVHRALRNGKP
jgi:DNA-binding MurR/RpiR family transcriptional regulator